MNTFDALCHPLLGPLPFGFYFLASYLSPSNSSQSVARKESAVVLEVCAPNWRVWLGFFLCWDRPQREPGSRVWLVSLARLSSRGSPAALAAVRRPRSSGDWLLCTGADALACLADWQRRGGRKCGEICNDEKRQRQKIRLQGRGRERKKSFTEKLMPPFFPSVALIISPSSTCSYLTSAKCSPSLICWSLMSDDYRRSMQRLCEVVRGTFHEVCVSCWLTILIWIRRSSCFSPYVCYVQLFYVTWNGKGQQWYPL